MSEKVILILVDGMRADSLYKCKNDFAEDFILKSQSSLNVRTVMPSVTLPCHMSLFHSVAPQRHGILTNTYVPQVRPVKGLFEHINKSGKTAASFYNWEELRDLSCPGSLAYSYFISLHHYKNTDFVLKNEALKYIKEKSPDFVFLYLGSTDHAGHKFGWMTEKYLNTVNNAWDCIKEIYEKVFEKYTLIVNSEQCGQEYMHGTDMDEDMTIPLIINSKIKFDIPKNATIMDIAPTIAKLLEINTDEDWEGNCMI